MPDQIIVLVAEDEELVRLVIAEVLQDEGFEVIEAQDGDEAIRLLDTAGGFDVLFTIAAVRTGPVLVVAIGTTIHRSGWRTAARTLRPCRRTSPRR